MPKTNKPRLIFGAPVAPVKENAHFEPVPFARPAGSDLAMEALAPEDRTRVAQAGRLVFQTVGDTGSDSAEAARAVSDAMEKQIRDSGAQERPAFFYHLGDVVYHHGKSTKYRAQFYEPFKFYPGLIFAIPGNHDGDPPESEASLTGFRSNFCSPQPVSLYPHRDTVTQPYAYWVLRTPLADIIGLYSNVEGMIDEDEGGEQEQWLAERLREGSPDKCLLLAVHHPPYSLDDEHGGSPLVGQAIDRAAMTAGRAPDVVLSGHSHCYQRLTRGWRGRQIPYLVAGAGGHAEKPDELGKLTRNEAGGLPACPFRTRDEEVVLDAFEEDNSGFLRITVTPEILLGEYFRVPFSGTAPTAPIDRFLLDWRKGTLEKSGA